MKEAYQESEAGRALNTDEELYARFLCGEDDAIRQLMDRYLERLTLFCFTFLHSLTEAEDMALDSFAVVAMKRSTWYGGSFQRWLYRIAHNLSISRFRKLRVVQVPFDEAHHLTESGAGRGLLAAGGSRGAQSAPRQACAGRAPRAHAAVSGEHELCPGGPGPGHGRKEGR